MELVHKIEEVRSIVRSWKKEGLSVGLVPTMGYLHEGHQSLIKKAVEENDRVVVIIFVKTNKFWEKEEIEKYTKEFNKKNKKI